MRPHFLDGARLAKSCPVCFIYSALQSTARSHNTSQFNCAIANCRLCCYFTMSLQCEFGKMVNNSTRASNRFDFCFSKPFDLRLFRGARFCYESYFHQPFVIFGGAQMHIRGSNFGTIFRFPFLGPFKRIWLGRSQKWEPKNGPKIGTKNYTKI